MNNLYLQKQVVKLKMQQEQREMEQARLLREAGLSRANFVAHWVVVLHKLLKARRNRLQGHRSVEHQSS